MQIQNDELASILTDEDIPGDLKRLRALLMFSWYKEQGGHHTMEEECICCGGVGWLNDDVTQTCPLCMGFVTVPTRLNDWYRGWLREQKAFDEGVKKG